MKNGFAESYTNARDIIALGGRKYLEQPSLGTVINVLNSDASQWRSEIEAALRLKGLSHLEVWLEYSPTERDARELAAMVRDIDTTVHGPFVDVNLATDWPELGRLSIRKVLRAIRVSEKLGAAVMTVHAGKYPVYEQPGLAVARFSERLRLLAESTPITVAVENLKAKVGGVSRNAIATRDDMASLIELFADTKLTLDVAHAVQNGEDPLEMMDAFRERIASVHVHDAARGEQSHRPFGEGVIDLSSLGAALMRYRPRYVTLETLGTEDTRRSWEALQSHLGAGGIGTRVA